MSINDEIYKEIAIESGVHKDKVEEACRSMFEFITETMEANKLQAVRLPYFVLVWCKPNRLKKLREKGMTI